MAKCALYGIDLSLKLRVKLCLFSVESEPFYHKIFKANGKVSSLFRNQLHPFSCLGKVFSSFIKSHVNVIKVRENIFIKITMRFYQKL